MQQKKDGKKTNPSSVPIQIKVPAVKRVMEVNFSDLEDANIQCLDCCSKHFYYRNVAGSLLDN
jgi:hypothetical protein